MSPGERNQSTAWATVVLILLVVIAILLIGYFAWWEPARRGTALLPAQQKRESAPKHAEKLTAPMDESRESSRVEIKEV